jgi:hypothetical protein
MQNPYDGRREMITGPIYDRRSENHEIQICRHDYVFRLELRSEKLPGVRARPEGADEDDPFDISLADLPYEIPRAGPVLPPEARSATWLESSRQVDDTIATGCDPGEGFAIREIRLSPLDSGAVDSRPGRRLPGHRSDPMSPGDQAREQMPSQKSTRAGHQHSKRRRDLDFDRLRAFLSCQLLTG